MIRLASYHYVGVPGLGTVVFSRHAQDKLKQDRVSNDIISQTLAFGTDTPDSQSIVFRQYRDVRLVIETRPKVNSGAAVCITGYRVRP